MKEFIEKLISRLEDNRRSIVTNDEDLEWNRAVYSCTKIVNQLAEEFATDTNVGNKDGWISCSDRLPDEHDSIYAEYKGTNKWHRGMFEKVSDDVNVTVEYEDGTRRTKTLHTVDGVWKMDTFLKCKVIAWQPLPQPYKEEGGKK